MKYGIITAKDAKTLKKAFANDAQRHMQFTALINKAASLRGQDMLMLKQAEAIADKLSSTAVVRGYKHGEKMDAETIAIPEYTGYKPYTKGFWATRISLSWALGGMLASNFFKDIADLAKGNTTTFVVLGSAIVVTIATALTVMSVGIIRELVKQSREIYQQFAQNIEANIVRELDALGLGKKSDPGVEKLANEMKLQGITQKDLDDKMKAIKESVESAKLENA